MRTTKNQVIKAKLLDRLTKVWIEANDRKIKIPQIEISLSNHEISRTTTDKKVDYIKTDFVMVNPEFLKKLKIGQLKVVIEIMGELNKNNMLWFKEYKNERDRYGRAISNLRKKGLIYETGDKAIHFINPWLIRRGDIKNILASMLFCLNKSAAFSEIDFSKNLKAPAKVNMDIYVSLLNANHREVRKQ